MNIHAQFLTRYGGSAFLGWAVTWFLARSAKTLEDLKKAGLLGGLVLGVTGLVVGLMNALAGVTNAFVWINPVIYLFLTIGFGWFYFKK